VAAVLLRIIKPGEQFYLAGESNEQIERMILRAAAIGYETAFKQTLVVKSGSVQEAEIDVAIFKNYIADYTIVDVRNVSEVKKEK
jgi:hypothetical protein